MRLQQYLKDNCSLDTSDSIEQHELSEMETVVTNQDVAKFISKWKGRFKGYGVTEFDLSDHFLLDRLRDKRNNPPISTDELDFVLSGFLRKMGTQFKKDVENVKNHTAKRRGFNKKAIPENELEFTVSSKSTKVNFVFVLKQDFHQKGTAIVLPMTVMRKKKFKVTKGEEVIVERRVL